MRKKMLSFLTQQKNTVKADTETEPKSESAGMKAVGSAFRAALSKKLDKFVATDRPKAQEVVDIEE